MKQFDKPYTNYLNNKSKENSDSRSKWSIPKSLNTVAIALSYDPNEMQAPEISCKGENELAKEILKISRNYNIPIRKSEDLVKKLQTVTAEVPIPESLYDDVAKVFLSLNKK